MSEKEFLKVENISKAFGGVQAVSDLNFIVQKGKAIGLIGPNGSGKTTVVNLITGFARPDSGQVFFKGEKITGLKPHKIANMGLTRTFQVMRPYHSLTVVKNLIIPLNSPRVRRTRSGMFGNMDTVAIDILEEIGFERDARVPYKLAGSLPLGYMKRLELARCLSLNPELIICDEIFSGLSMSEIASMVPLLEKIQMDGVTLIMIEHRLRELFRLADAVIAMNFGRKIAEGPPEEVIEKEEVKAAYLGSSKSK